MNVVLDEPVLVFTEGRLGRIRLNRPKAINSLTVDMVRMIVAALDRFEQDERIIAILLDGAGERGLCAGGDIRALYENGRARNGKASLFLREQYAMNARIANLTKPFIAIMDGLTLGGGMGVSAHGSHRIVTERSRLGMPEVGIGFVPDVGITWYLARAPGEVGTYLALTGEVFGPGEAIALGFADTMVRSSRLVALGSALAEAASAEAIDDIIARFADPAPSSHLEGRVSEINHAFRHDVIEPILADLAQLGSVRGAHTRDLILTKSPTSLRVTLHLLRLARAASDVETCILNEYRCAIHCLRGRDFYEGVRAAVIDKDRSPRWDPEFLKDVASDIANHYLESLAREPDLTRVKVASKDRV